MIGAKILHQAAIMFASDLPKTIRYWNEKIGFDTRNTFSEPPEFAILGRDGSFVMLRLAPAGHPIVPYWKLNEGLWNAYFWVNDVRALFEEIKTRGANIDYELYQQPYNVLEFAIQDPDGQSIGFGQELNPSLMQNSKV